MRKFITKLAVDIFFIVLVVSGVALFIIALLYVAWIIKTLIDLIR